jgi:hypothetical protein
MFFFAGCSVEEPKASDVQFKTTSWTVVQGGRFEDCVVEGWDSGNFFTKKTFEFPHFSFLLPARRFCAHF